MEANKIIYFDNAATTKVDEDCLLTYTKVINQYYGNPASIHSYGSYSKRLLDISHDKVISSLKLKDYEVIFCSGSTEASNLALKGYCLKYQNRGKHIISSTIEHPAILNTLSFLESLGFKVDYIRPEKEGFIDIDKVRSLIKDNTILISIMLTNNETGISSDIKELFKLKQKYPKLRIHSDVTQSICKMDIDYNSFDMFSFSFHKVHGLHSSGCLIKRKNIELVPLLHGGGQENNYRSGTSDVALCYANAINFEKQVICIQKNFDYIKSLAFLVYEYLQNNLDKYHINSNLNNPYIINFSLIKKKASVVVEALSNKGIMVSSISACHSSKEKSSHVVFSMLNDTTLANNTIRVSLSKYNTKDEVMVFIKELDAIIKEIR